MIDYKKAAIDTITSLADKHMNIEAMEFLAKYYNAQGKQDKVSEYLDKIYTVMIDDEKNNNQEHCLSAARKVVKLYDTINFCTENKDAVKSLRGTLK